jgi:hypothetical protein
MPSPPVRQALRFGRKALFAKTVAYRAWTLAHPRFRRGQVRLDDLTRHVDPRDLPPLDRYALPRSLTDRQRQWAEHGYVILERAIPEPLVDAYVEFRAALPERLDGQAYLRFPQMRELALHPQITAATEELMGEEMGLSLSLSNWASTERNWHQDEYLNPPHVKAHYLGAWIALEDIDPTSGPFEFIPGSHRWGILSRARVQRFVSLNDVRSPDWTKRSEEVLNQIYARLIEERGAQAKQFLGRKGDVLLWHACLAHRGSIPKDRAMKRRALICHYTALSRGASNYPRLVAQRDVRAGEIAAVPAGGKFFFLDDYAE